MFINLTPGVQHFPRLVRWWPGVTRLYVYSVLLTVAGGDTCQTSKTVLQREATQECLLRIDGKLLPVDIPDEDVGTLLQDRPRGAQPPLLLPGVVYQEV